MTGPLAGTTKKRETFSGSTLGSQNAAILELDCLELRQGYFQFIRVTRDDKLERFATLDDGPAPQELCHDKF
jgi:hypothetical protein